MLSHTIVKIEVQTNIEDWSRNEFSQYMAMIIAIAFIRLNLLAESYATLLTSEKEFLQSAACKKLADMKNMVSVLIFE